VGFCQRGKGKKGGEHASVQARGCIVLWKGAATADGGVRANRRRSC
jgi:hypothetical protein